MLRVDGTFVVYMLQFCNPRLDSDNPYGGWRDPNYDHFGTPLKSEKNGFAASGDCWQATGLHGTFDEAAGRAALKEMQTDTRWHRNEVNWRLVRRTFVQHTDVVAS